jgi:hypothetical protein
MIFDFINFDFLNFNKKKKADEEIIKEDKFPLNKVSFDYSDSTKTREEQIALEKRRRNQVYKALDYILSAVSYFDFFSLDAFNILRYTKYYSQLVNKKNVTSELLLLPFLGPKSPMLPLMHKFDLTTPRVGSFIIKYNAIKPPSFFETLVLKLKFFIHKLRNSYFMEEFSLKPKVRFSKELNNILLQAADNALNRFKGPIITSEILFITMMEGRSTRVGKIITHFLPEKLDWLMLRFYLLKDLHAQVVGVRNDVPKSHQYFAFLLQSQLPEAEFKRLLNEKLFAERVSIFRNKLVREVLDFDLNQLIEEDIYKSIRILNKRKYTHVFSKTKRSSKTPIEIDVVERKKSSLRETIDMMKKHTNMRKEAQMREEEQMRKKEQMQKEEQIEEPEVRIDIAELERVYTERIRNRTMKKIRKIRKLKNIQDKALKNRLENEILQAKNIEDEEEDEEEDIVFPNS